MSEIESFKLDEDFDLNEDLDLDDDFLMSEPPSPSTASSTVPVPSLPPIQKLPEFLREAYKQQDSIPRQDLHREYMKEQSKREKMLRDLRTARNNIRRWIAKSKLIEEQINRSTPYLESLRSRMMETIIYAK